MPNLDLLSHQVDWDTQFPQQETTSLVGRMRANRQQRAREDYANELLTRRAEEQARLIQTDRNAANAYFQNERLKIAERNAQSSIALKEQELANAAALQPLNIKLKEAQIARAANAEALAAKTALAKEQDTSDFALHMSQLMERAKPGSDEWKMGILQGVSQFPHADRALIRTYDAPVREDTDLQQLLSTLPAGFDLSSVRRGANGQWAVEARPESIGINAEEQKTRGEWMARLSHLENQRLQAEGKGSEERISYYDREIERAKARLGLAPQKEPPTETAPTPKVGERTLVNNQAEYDALPSGAKFIWQGKELTKK